MSEWDFLEEDNHFDLEEFLKKRAEEQKAEYENLSYFQREEIKDVKRKSKEAFEKIRVSKEVVDCDTKIYWHICRAKDMHIHDKKNYLEKSYNAFNKNDIETLENIYDEICQPLAKRNLNFYKDKILHSLGCNISEIQDILSVIKNDYEADIVLASVQGSDWITKLPKQYPVEPIYSKYTYKDQVSLHRRMLEKDLLAVGVGARRAQKISQILLSI